MSVKITMIGAGSIGFTRRLVWDILAVPELQDVEFAFTDINSRNLDMVTQLVSRDIKENKLPTKISATQDRRRAIDGAKYVFSLVRVGGLEAFQKDIDIPLKYGIDQCVGDTLCPGGIMYAQRGIPVLLEFCKDINQLAAPNALFLNYSNPMAMNCWACNHYGGVHTIGLCHGVENSINDIALALDVPASELTCVAAGINHQTWFLSVKHKGIEMVPHLLEAFEKHPVLSKTEKVRIDMLRRFGYFTTESNGHISEYVPWYRKRTEEINKWIDMSMWIHGETGGYLRYCVENRNWFETDFPKWLSEAPHTIKKEDRSHERGSYIIEALETGRIYRTHFNVVNNGCITNLPEDCIVEAPGYVDYSGINIPVIGDLPLGCAATCNSSVQVQRMSVLAAVTGDIDLLRLAMLHDPLTGAVCNPHEVWQLTDEMLVALAEYLPQYADEIPEARKRLNAVTPRLSVGWKGAARKEIRSVEQVRTAKAGT